MTYSQNRQLLQVHSL